MEVELWLFRSNFKTLGNSTLPDLNNYTLKNVDTTRRKVICESFESRQKLHGILLLA